MPSTHNQLRAGTLDLLQDDSTFMNLVGGRIYPRSLAELSVDSDGVDVSNIVFPATTFRVAGSGSPETVGPPFEPQLIVQHWSENDYSEAWEIADRFRIVLHRIRVDKGGVIFFWDTTNAGQEAFDPDHSLFYVIQQFRSSLLGS